MKILLVNNGTKYLEELKALLSTAGGLTVSETPECLDNISEFDLVVLSGGHHSPIVGHEDAFRREIEFIKSNVEPLLGICLGAELIAHTFGAKLEHLKREEKAIKSIEVLGSDGLFSGIESFKVYESHKWAITELPECLVGLARSEDGFEIFRHKDRPVYGFQFHPEMFEDKTVGVKIFQNFLSLVRADRR